MNNSVVIGSIAEDDVYYRMKRVAYPGRMLASNGNSWGFEGGNYFRFNTVHLDNWYPQAGLASDYNFVVPIGGVYQILFHTRFPDYGQPGVGWGYGWSGSGSGDVWMELWRGGTLIEGNIGRQHQDWPGGSNPTYDIGPFQRTLLAGDSIRAKADAGATGLGPSAWDTLLDMMWLPGGGGAQIGSVPQAPAGVSGPTGNTQGDMGIGGAANDGWIQGSNCIYTNYGDVIPYQSARDAGYRLQGRITLDATYSGAGAYARFLSANDTYASAIMQNAQTPNPWTSAWVDISPPTAPNIQVRLQISRVSGGIGKNIAVSSCLQQFQWVNP